MDTVIVLVRERPRDRWGILWQTFAAYQVTAAYVALWVATRLPVRRKLAALVLGLTFVHAYLLVILVIGLFDGFAEHSAMCRVSGGHTDLMVRVGEALSGFERLLEHDLTVCFVPSLLIWSVTCFRMADWGVAQSAQEGRWSWIGLHAQALLPWSRRSGRS